MMETAYVLTLNDFLSWKYRIANTPFTPKLESIPCGKEHDYCLPEHIELDKVSKEYKTQAVTKTVAQTVNNI
jgi:hypothetical protein